jgi:lantibiotic modifying enzyme
VPGTVAEAAGAEPVSVAVRVGDLLLDTAWRGDGRANWAGVQDLGAGEWAVLAMGMGLGDGYCGPALFLAELGRATGESRFTRAAAEAVRPLPRMLRLLAAHPELAAAVGPGGFSGLGGVAYATARLARLLDADAGSQAGDGLAAALPDALTALAAAAAAPDAAPDVADGLAGALLAARAVHATAPHPLTAALLRDLPRRIAAAPAPSAPGFLHGRTGLAYALAAAAPAAAASGARAADPGRGADPGGEARADAAAAEHARADGPADASAAAGDLSWCSGLAGAAAAFGGAVSERHLAAVGAAGGASAHDLWLRDLSLCHGESGLLEPLAALPGPAGAEARRRAGERLAAAVARAAAHGGIRCGTPLGVPTPGLLTGLAGIGYGLLRLAPGATIPSVLLLEPSRPAEARRTTERARTPWTTT